MKCAAVRDGNVLWTPAPEGRKVAKSLATGRARSRAIAQPISATKGVRVGEAAGDRDLLHGKPGGAKHAMRVFEAEPAQQLARRLAVTFAEAADEVLPTDSAERRHRLQV